MTPDMGMIEIPEELLARIHQMSAERISTQRIAEILTEEGVPTARGRRKEWGWQAVRNLLLTTRLNQDGLWERIPQEERSRHIPRLRNKQPEAVPTMQPQREEPPVVLTISTPEPVQVVIPQQSPAQQPAPPEPEPVRAVVPAESPTSIFSHPTPKPAHASERVQGWKRHF